MLEDLKRSRGAHAGDRRRGLRRRRPWTAGTCLSQRRGRDHRDARPAARSPARAVRAARSDRVPRARRSRSHARHGFPAGDSQASSATCPRSARRSSSARRCRRRSGSWRARCCTTRWSSSASGRAAPPTGITQAVYPVSQELKSALLVALLRRGDMTQALVFTRTKHRANRLADYLLREGGQSRSHPRQSIAAAADGGARRVQGRARARARRDRHRGARHRRRSARPRRELRRAARAPTTTSIASAARVARRPRVKRSRSWRPTSRAISPPSSARSAGKLPRVTVPDFDYSRAAGGASSRSRSRSASRRFARARRRNVRDATRSPGVMAHTPTGSTDTDSRRASGATSTASPRPASADSRVTSPRTVRAARDGASGRVAGGRSGRPSDHEVVRHLHTFVHDARARISGQKRGAGVTDRGGNQRVVDRSACHAFDRGSSDEVRVHPRGKHQRRLRETLRQKRRHELSRCAVGRRQTGENGIRLDQNSRTDCRDRGNYLERLASICARADSRQVPGPGVARYSPSNRVVASPKRSSLTPMRSMSER